MRIYLIRHTEADDDKRDSYGGITDDPLIDSGREYANKVGGVLKEKGIERIYTSPYLRARETAEIIRSEIGVDLVELYNLRERNSYGVLSGIEKDRAESLFPEVAERVRQMKESDVKPGKTIETLPGGEIYLELVLRIKDAFVQILRESKELGHENIAVLTHGGIAWAFFKEIMGKEKELGNGEVVVLEGEEIENLSVVIDESEELNQRI